MKNRLLACVLSIVLVSSVVTLATTPLSFASHGDITVETDKLVYQQGFSVVISGIVEDFDEGDEVEINVYNWEDNTILSNEDAEIRDDGEFDTVFDLDSDEEGGGYRVEVEYDGNTGITFFQVEGDDPIVEMEIEEDVYEPGDTVEITGEVTDTTSEDQIDIIVFGPDGAEIEEETLDLESDDSFEFDFDLEDDAEHGTYLVQVIYDEDNVAGVVFEIEDEDSGSNGGGGSSGNGDITVETDEENYDAGDTVEITGEVDAVSGEDEVRIIVNDPEDEEIVDEDVELESDDSFEFDFDLEDDAEDGDYTIIVSYDGEEEEITFEVGAGTDEEDENDDEVTVEINKSSYLAGEEITVSGEVYRSVNDATVNIHVVNPEGFITGPVYLVEPENDLTYEYTFTLKRDFEPGEGYKIRAIYNEDFSSEASFRITGTTGGINDDFVVETDDDEYDAGDTIVITGEIPTILNAEGQRVVIKVTNPDGVVYRLDQVAVSENDSYEYELVVGGELGVRGEYEVEVSIGEDRGEGSFVIVSLEEQVFDLRVDGETFEIPYGIEGGSIRTMIIDDRSTSLRVSIDSTDDGTLTIELPREVIDSLEDGEDSSYIVSTIDLDTGATYEIEVIEAENNAGERVLVIAYNEGVDLIEIAGTQVVPEFGTIAAMILAVAIVGIIAATARFQNKFGSLKF